jgi:NADPH2:quinone reductase
VQYIWCYPSPKGLLSPLTVPLSVPLYLIIDEEDGCKYVYFMRAVEVIEFGDADALTVTETERPEPIEGQVLVEVEAAGINFADIMQRRGHYHGGPEPPYIPGVEVAGTIAEVGDGVNREESEGVVSLVNGGGYAEYAIADARGLLDIPGDLSFEEAAGFPAQWLTAHNCLHEWGGSKKASQC